MEGGLMAKGKRYWEGSLIEKMDEFEKWTDIGGWIYWHGRPKHPAFMMNQQYRTIKNLIRHKMLRRAFLAKLFI